MSIPSTGNLVVAYRAPDFDAPVTPDAPHGITYRPEKNGAGSAAFSIPMDDIAYGDIDINDFVAIRRPTLSVLETLTWGGVVLEWGGDRLEWDAPGTADDSVTVAVLLVEQIDEHTLDVQGGARETATYMGRLAGAQMEWALIAPALGDRHKPVEEDAIFDWRSPRYSPAAYSDPWENSSEIMTVTAAKTGGWPTQPMGEDFTDSTGAYMIWHSSGDDTTAPEGTCLFYLDIDITDPGRYGLEVLMDNDGYVWVDGVQQLEINQTEGYHRASFKRIFLSEAEHHFCFQVRNFDGPAALAFNLFKTDHQDKPMDGVPVVAISDSSAQVLEYPDPFPGMTVGDDFTQLVEEARDGTVEADRDVFPWLVCDFDLTNDSNGDPFDRVSITTKTQTTNLLQFLDELVAAERISRWRVLPDGVTLQVFAPGFSSRPTFSAPYAAGYELEPAPVNDPRSGQLVQLDRKIT